jgi:hypothetical protein
LRSFWVSQTGTKQIKRSVFGRLFALSFPPELPPPAWLIFSKRANSAFGAHNSGGPWPRDPNSQRKAASGTLAQWDCWSFPRLSGASVAAPNELDGERGYPRLATKTRLIAVCSGSPSRRARPALSMWASLGARAQSKRAENLRSGRQAISAVRRNRWDSKELKRCNVPWKNLVLSAA